MDVYILKPSDSTDKIDFFYQVTTRSRRNSARWETTLLHTKSGLRLPLPEGQRYDFPDTCSLTIQRGVIFRNPVKLIILYNGVTYRFPANELNRTFGGKVMLIAIFVLFLIIGFQICTKMKINDVAILISSLFTFYLFLDALFDIESLLINLS